MQIWLFAFDLALMSPDILDQGGRQSVNHAKGYSTRYRVVVTETQTKRQLPR